MTQGWRRRARHCPICCRAGSACPSANITSRPTPRWPSFGPSISAYIANRADAPPAIADAERRGAAHLRPRDQDRPGAREPRERARISPRRATVWTPRRAEKKAPGIDWDALLGAAQLGIGGRSSRPIMRAAIPRWRRWSRSQPLDAWKDWLAFHKLNQRRQRAAESHPRRQLRLLRHGAGGHAATAPARQARARRGQRRSAATRSARPMSTNISRPRPRPKSRRWSTSIKAAFAKRVEGDRLDGAGDQGRKRSRRSRRSSSASAIPTRWRDYRRSTISADRRLCQPEIAGELDRISRTSSPRSASRWTGPNGG